MQRRFDPQQMETLLASGRRDLLDPTQLLALVPIRPYQTVADIGCAHGYFTIPLAKYLFDGRVYAVDIQQEMLDALSAHLQQINLTNVKLVCSTETVLGLEEDSLDGALLGFVLHEMKDRARLLTQVMELLQRGGWLAVLEWHKREMEEGPPLEDRLAREEVEELARAVGFRFVESRDVNAKQYMVLLRK